MLLRVISFRKKDKKFQNYYASPNIMVVDPGYSNWLFTFIFFLSSMMLLFISSCDTKINSGVKKDFDTGIETTYQNMEPGNVLLVMNNETLKHTDIPLGESFILVNDNITGMKVKDEKVSAGCSLKITDEKGNVLMNEKDLFMGEDVFPKEEATQLKCTINTGKPMEWEEKYNIEVIFWDKYGDGKIVNQFTIRSIDIP